MNPSLNTAGTGRSERERLDELLTDRVTIGLDPTEWDELAALLDVHPEVDPESWERTAAEIDQALSASHSVVAEPLPDHLRRGIVAQGRLAVRAARANEAAAKPQRSSSGPARSGPSTFGSTAPDSTPMREPRTAPAPRLGWLGTAAGVAAGLALALLVLPAPRQPPAP